MLRVAELADVADDDAALTDLLSTPDTGPATPDGDSAFTPDPEPDYGRLGLEDRIFPDGSAAGKATTKRVSIAVRKDIRAKVAMLLMLVGSAWSARDAHCGGALLDSVGDREDEGRVGVASALTDIICDSPDLVGFFTTSGSYMKWLTLALAVQPLATTVVGHHITHTVHDDGEPDWSATYATTR